MVEAFKAQWWRRTGRKISWPDLDKTILDALDAALAVSPTAPEADLLHPAAQSDMTRALLGVDDRQRLVARLRDPFWDAEVAGYPEIIAQRHDAADQLEKDGNTK